MERLCRHRDRFVKILAPLGHDDVAGARAPHLNPALEDVRPGMLARILDRKVYANLVHAVAGELIQERLDALADVILDGLGFREIGTVNEGFHVDGTSLLPSFFAFATARLKRSSFDKIKG
jgi:hypothetical protein